MDRIHIRELALRCIVGISAEERREKQDLLISLTLHADLSSAGKSDRLADSVDYKAVKKAVMAALEGSSFQLVESVAETTAQVCLGFPGVRLVDVLVEKPGALRFARTAAVEITRSRTP